MTAISDMLDDLPFKSLVTTKAFKERDANWPFESWPDGEWKACIKEARKELK